MDLAFHRSPDDIEGDLEFYFTDQRDKHNQIRPSDDIRSFTPDAHLFTETPAEGEVGNLFHPFRPYSLDRIFIGISFPLFSNNWGAAFLRHLLGLIKPNGAIILPVYPEVQARDQGYWCRSSLENIFRSRSRFKGISNIWAENDGVMSMRVGRKWPPVIPSTARWLLDAAPRQVTALMLEQSADAALAFWQKQITAHWKTGCQHAILEQIILNTFGPRRPVCLDLIGEDCAPLALECLYSPYTCVAHARIDGGVSALEELAAVDRFCQVRPHGEIASLNEASDNNNLDVLCVTEAHTGDLSSALCRLASGGLVILMPECATLADTLGSRFSAPEYYSDRAAKNLAQPIYHYSERIEEEIACQRETHEGAYAVLRKS